MNNTPPKYDEDIDWKKYLEQSLQEQIKTTDAVRNLPYELNIEQLSKEIKSESKEIYKSVNYDVSESISDSIEKTNKEIGKELTKYQPPKFDPEEIAEPIAETNKGLLNKIIDTNKNVAIKTAEVMGENIREGYREVGSVVGGHINDVIGPNIQRAYSESKVVGGYVLKLMGGLFSIFKTAFKKDKDETQMYGDINEFTKAATSKGSIYTHDITAEEYLKENNEYFKREEKRRLREIKGKDDKGGFWKILITATLLFFGFLYGRFKKFSDIVNKLVIKPLRLFSSKLWTSISKTFKESKIGKALMSLGNWFKELGKTIITKIKGTKIGAKLFGAMDKLWDMMGKMWSWITKSKIFKFYDWFKGIGTKIDTIPMSSMKKFPGLIGTVKNFITTMFSSLKGITKFKKLASIVGKFMIRLKFIPFFFGELIGKIFMPIEMVYRMIKGLFTEGSIRDKILAMSSGILEAVLHIPEMLGNAILWLLRKFFGETFLKGFKFDFSTKKIIEAVNGITKWVGQIIDPLVNFFGKTLPDLFDKVKNYFKRQIDEAKFYLNPLNWGKSYEEERQGNRFDDKTGKLLQNAGESEEAYRKRIWEWRKTLQPQNIEKPSISKMEEQQVEVAKSVYGKKQQQIQTQQQIQAEMLKSNKDLAEQNKNVTQTIINTTNMISQRGQDTKEIPNQNENAILSLVSTGALM